MYILFKDQTTFNEEVKYLYISSKNINKKNEVLFSLDTGKMISNTWWFNYIAEKRNLWNNLQPGRYKIKKGTSIYELINKLRSGIQSPIPIIIKKIRLKEQLAAICGNALEQDSTQFMEYFNSSELQSENGINDYTLLSYIIPNTYFIFWNTTPSDFILRMKEEYNKFWNVERLQKAALLKLTPLQIYSLASIIEEETLRNDEKQIIASVYLNRLRLNMKLEADPTVKYCTKNFALKRITFKHIDSNLECLYNTYHHYGLPPGPICTPSISTIDATLKPAKTDYLYFCAKPERDGYHYFAKTLKEHINNANNFHRMLNANKIK